MRGTTIHHLLIGVSFALIIGLSNAVAIRDHDSASLTRYVTHLSKSITVRRQPADLIDTCSRTNSTIEECIDPKPNDCSFYPLCLEPRFHCGPSGYPLGYGLKYCTKSREDRNQLSPAGQAWIVQTMLCLQRKLVPFDIVGSAQQNITTCDALKDYAFGTHPACYIEGGICSLPVSDWEDILNNIITIPQLLDPEVFKNALQTAAGCAEFYLWLVAKGIF